MPKIRDFKIMYTAVNNQQVHKQSSFASLNSRGDETQCWHIHSKLKQFYFPKRFSNVRYFSLIPKTPLQAIHHLMLTSNLPQRSHGSTVQLFLVWIQQMSTSIATELRREQGTNDWVKLLSLPRMMADASDSQSFFPGFTSQLKNRGYVQLRITNNCTVLPHFSTTSWI